jgi:hypothetical protein
MAGSRRSPTSRVFFLAFLENFLVVSPIVLDPSDVSLNVIAVTLHQTFELGALAATALAGRLLTFCYNLQIEIFAR